MNELFLVSCAVLGTLVASVLACVPALHIYNVAGLLVAFLARFRNVLSPQAVAMFMLGTVVGYAIVNAVPALFLAVPDESTVWMVSSGQRYLAQRRGYEALVLVGIGSLGGVVVLLFLAPFVTAILEPIRRILQPHLHWVIGLFALYLLVSEWPKGIGRGESLLDRLWDGWRSLFAGLLTFVLSGVLGTVLAFGPIIRPEASYQGLMPAFVGLFAVPWLLQNAFSRTRIPDQHICTSIDVTPSVIVRGVAAGTLGGLLAALFPVVTGGIGSLVAGHATAQRDERAFIVSQGAAKVVYYVGAVLLFFAPELRLTRGGMAWLLGTFYTPYTRKEYWLAVSAAALCGALAFVLLLLFARWAARLVSRVPYRWIFWGTMLLLVALLVATTGLNGVGIALVATAIGLVPVLCHSRRTNCMGVLFVPMLLDMAGLGSVAAGWL